LEHVFSFGCNMSFSRSLSMSLVNFPFPQLPLHTGWAVCPLPGTRHLAARSVSSMELLENFIQGGGPTCRSAVLMSPPGWCTSPFSLSSFSFRVKILMRSMSVDPEYVFYPVFKLPKMCNPCLLGCGRIFASYCLARTVFETVIGLVRGVSV